MRHFLGLLFLFIFSFNLFAAPGAHGPDGQHLTDESQNAGTGLGRQPDGSVIMPMSMQAALKIETLFAQSETVSRTESFSGVVRPHSEGHSVIQPGNNGHYYATRSGTPMSGSTVKMGDVLGYVQYSDTAFELASQNSELLSVRNDIAQAQRDVKRLKELGELASKQELERLETRLKTLSEQETALEKGIEKPIPLIASRTGVLLNHQVSDGKWVQAGTVLFEIISPYKRIIEVHVLPSQLHHEVVTASIIEYSGEKLGFIGRSPKLEQGLSTLYFEYVATESTNARLPIDQHVSVVVEFNNNRHGIVLPDSAVVNNSNNLPVVWIKASAERFIPQIVEYQSLSDNHVLITHGLGKDNRVVINGTSLLNQVR